MAPDWPVGYSRVIKAFHLGNNVNPVCVPPLTAVVFSLVSSCGASLVGPSGDIKSPNNPNVYPSNAYCRWKVSVPSDKKVMVTFNSFKTQKNYDVVEIFDGVSRQEITVLSGVYSNPVVITSESNAIDIKFVADGSDESDGFSATFQQVCKC